jgi:glycosyltransferase involved in cell wall biosynthesis
MSIKLSVCMIVKNEENFIESSINNFLDYVDEIIVIDTGSTDKTLTILESWCKVTSKIKLFNFDWVDDFSAARNYSLSKATGDWIFVIDPDEYVEEKELKNLKKKLSSTALSGFQIIQRTYTNNSDQTSWRSVDPNYQFSKGFFGYFDTPITRIFKNNSQFQFQGKVHEDITPSIREQKEPLIKSDLVFHHYEYSRGKDFVKDKQLYYLNLTLKKIKDNPHEPKSYADAGIIYYTYKGNFEKALYYFNEALKVDEKYAMAYNYIAKILSEKGLKQEAIKKLEEGIALGLENDTIFVNLGVIYMGQGKLDAAKEMFKKAIGLNSSRAAPHYNLGLIFLKQEQFVEAKDEFKMALRLNPMDARAYLYLAKIYSLIDQPKKAIHYYQILIDGDHPDKANLIKLVNDLKNKIYK